RLEEKGVPPAGRKYQRIVRGNLGRADGAFRRFFVTGKRRVAHLLETRGIELDLAGRCAEAAVLIFPVLEGNFVETLLLELIEGHVNPAAGEHRIEHILDRL